MRRAAPPSPLPDPRAQPSPEREVLPAPAGPPAVAAEPATADQGVQVLTRGPVHEAFAEPIQYDSAHPLIAPKAPPAAIEEVPPEAIPAGDNVTWIPGYWAWDDDLRDYIWVSGIWRDVPPGQIWVPGYWAESGSGGYQWVPGFWTSGTQQSISYLPEPPANPVAGPSTPAPAEDDFWVPGSWVYESGRYVLQPGYWSQLQPDWVWTPSHYAWTPNGYIFISGYWDHPLAHRGVLFAPVSFARDVYGRRDFTYTPSIALDAGLLPVNLFARADYGHYYFGDYYGDNYTTAGFQPWFAQRGSREAVAYDPLFNYYRSYYGRRDPAWFNRQQERYAYLRNHPDGRPLRTYRDLDGIAPSARRDFNGFTSLSQRDMVMAAPYRDFVNRSAGLSSIGEFQGTRNLHFQNLDAAERQRIRGDSRTIRDFGIQRSQAARTAGSEGSRTFSVSPLAKVYASGRTTSPQTRVVERPLIEPGRTEPPLTRTTPANDGIPNDLQPQTNRPILNEGSNPGRERPLGSPNLGGPRPSEMNNRLPPAGAGARGQEPRPTSGNGGINPSAERRNPDVIAPRQNSERPNLTDRPTTAPRVTEPRVAEPRVTEPRVTAPRVEPRAAEPRVTEPRATEPRTAAPRVTEPRAVQPLAESASRAPETRSAERPQFIERPRPAPSGPPVRRDAEPKVDRAGPQRDAPADSRPPATR